MNLVMVMSSKTMKAAAAPRPLMAALVCQFDPRTFRQCSTMPVWLMVKPMNTPAA